MSEQQSDKPDTALYGDAFEFWWATAGLPHATKPEAWEAWKASARRPDETVPELGLRGEDYMLKPLTDKMQQIVEKHAPAEGTTPRTDRWEREYDFDVHGYFDAYHDLMSHARHLERELDACASREAAAVKEAMRLGRESAEALRLLSDADQAIRELVTPVSATQQPVAWLEADPSAAGKTPEEVIGSIMYSSKMTFNRTYTGHPDNPHWPRYTAPVSTRPESKGDTCRKDIGFDQWIAHQPYRALPRKDADSEIVYVQSQMREAWEAGSTASSTKALMPEIDLWKMVRAYHGWQTDDEMVKAVGYGLEIYVEKMRQAVVAGGLVNVTRPFTNDQLQALHAVFVVLNNPSTEEAKRNALEMVNAAFSAKQERKT